MATTRKRPDDDTVRGLQFVNDGPCDVAQATGHPMPLHRTADRFGHHQTDAGPVVWHVAMRSQRMHHEIGLHCPHPLTDGGTELRRSRHPVPRRKHRARSRVESRSQLAATLGTPTRHDGPAGPGAHPQPEPVHPRPTAVVGLEGPLALGHGCSLLVAFGIRHPRR